ncbi:MAG TPA: helix-turn-helix transcriptional regulator [Candidatus Fimivivens faecavium]|nr:helix-turn-helix transcriptional regulator [Candidatus Fimivivens faecavium]
MINYKEIGQSLRQARLSRAVTQEQLAERAGVGTTHISHIETGNSIPSLKTLVAILNALECSADEVLCRELKAAKPVFDHELSKLLDDCDSRETRIIADTVRALKNSLRKG